MPPAAARTSTKRTRAGKGVIAVRGAAEHNLRNVDVEIPRDSLVVITGVSGSGKSSLAFDTVFAEGQRKYMESLTAYARQFLQQLSKPAIESIEGLPPTIAIQQRSGGHNPRSTVATTTEIQDYLRLLYARAGRPTCWAPVDGGGTCGRPIEGTSSAAIVQALLQLASGTRLMLCAPIVRARKGYHKDVLEDLQRAGFVRVRVNGTVHDLRDVLSRDGENPLDLGRYEQHDIEAVVDRIVISPDVKQRLQESVETSLRAGGGLLLTLEERDGEWITSHWSEHLACTEHPACAMEAIEPRLFSFNSPFGACQRCDGLGSIREFDTNLVIPDPSLPFDGGAVLPWRGNGKRMNSWYARQMRKFREHAGVDKGTPFNKLNPKHTKLLLYGAPPGRFKFEGVLTNLTRRWRETESEHVREKLAQYMAQHTCPECHGARLRSQSVHVMLPGPDGEGVSLADVGRMTITQASTFFDELQLSTESAAIAAPILREVQARLGFLMSVGLEYLTLDRAANTLSGGEAQRIRLATQVGSGLVGVCYVLDEPTIGLHQRDNARLIRTLRGLADIGNTVLVVEHDEEMIRAADQVIDMGPGAGVHGGSVVAQGTVKQLQANRASQTGDYLAGRKHVGDADRAPRLLNAKKALTVKGARANNLQSIDVAFPLHGLTCVTGVSGSGKSTLVNDVLLQVALKEKHGARVIPGGHDRVNGLHLIDRIVQVDQSPIGRTPRSNPATYTSIFDDIRKLFAATREARLRGWQPGRFSFNVKGGRCEECQGQGVKRIEMHFLPDVFVTCTACEGTRYDPQTLEVKWKGKSIADVLDMTIEEAAPFFEAQGRMHRMLVCLNEVGLGYLELGQKATTLSGGEAQRVKLARELGANRQGSVLYILDEPTTGLHFSDVDRLLSVLQRLADRGNTLIVIEHNLDVIKAADWIIDLGPEGGSGGGTVVATGTPSDIAAIPESRTGACLRDID
ncbi:MAG: excinuclease ABC subunit UvrA [Phycisphaerales bacterium]|nr:excinuclease ABC subunit UvrA [Phycisphaerales bacterium]